MLIITCTGHLIIDIRRLLLNLVLPVSKSTYLCDLFYVAVIQQPPKLSLIISPAGGSPTLLFDF